MLTPIVNIIIGTLKFKGCKSFEVNTDVNNLSVTGKAELPLRAMLIGGDERQRIMVDESIKQGDPIRIEAGYAEEEIRTVFNGFISNIDPADSIKLTFEDAIYLMRKQPIIIDEEDITVADLCKKLLPEGYSLSKQIINTTIDAFKYKGNAAGALARLKESMRLSCYFDGKELFVGGHQMNPKGQIKLIYGRNILKNQTSYQYADVNPVQVTMIGKKEDGTEVKVVVGQEGGSAMTFHKYNVTDKALLTTMANEELKRYSFNGFKGSLKIWFIPFAEVGGSVLYKNENYKQEVEGTYFIKGVKYSFTIGGGLKQQLKLGAKLK